MLQDEWSMLHKQQQCICTATFKLSSAYVHLQLYVLCTNLQMRKIAAAQEQQQGALTSTAASADQLQQLTGLSNLTFTSTMKACKLRERSLEAAVESGSASGKEQRGSSPLDQICTNINDDSCAAMDSSANAAECLINGALQQLPDAEAKVLHHVYGLQDGLPKSRRQVGCVFGSILLSDSL